MAALHGDFPTTIGHWLDERTNTTNAEVPENLHTLVQVLQQLVTLMTSDGKAFCWTLALDLGVKVGLI